MLVKPNQERESRFENRKMTFQLSSTPLKDTDLRRGFTSPQAGAFNCFEGRARDHSGGKSVTALEYEAHEPLCRKEAKKMFQEAKRKFNIIDVKAAHRIGRLKVGETAVWVGVLAAHRDDSFQACRYIIDEIKSRLPIWKKEYYADGDSGWVGCPPKESKESSPVSIEITSLPKKELERFILVDIREAVELQGNPVREVKCVHLPLSQFEKRRFRFDQSKRYVIFCAKGMRSLSLVEHLRKEGITNVFSLQGGIQAIRDYFKIHDKKN